MLIRVGVMDPAEPFDWMARGGMAGVALLQTLHLYPILYLLGRAT